MASLKKWILINASFSTICALICLLFYPSIASSFGMKDSAFVFELGMSLLVFVAFILYTVYKLKLKKTMVYAVIAMDASWVLVSLCILLWQAFDLNREAYYVIGMVASFVGLFAWKQYKSLG